MRKLIIILVLILLWPPFVFGIEPIGINNKFGMHVAVATDEDLEAVAKLVNSNGGKWGYITLVIQDNDLDSDKWQERFNKLRRLKLIPIIRLATHPEGENWVAAKPDEAKKWVDFLNSLNWVIKNRYVVLFNEPNHATEWGGGVDPESYARTALSFAKALKKSNADYFVMLAGLDQAAPDATPRYLSAKAFLEASINQIGVNNFKQYFDGLCSHSYPNPGFSASPANKGWGSVSGYENELWWLQELGVNKELPVFITETGWQRGVLDEFMVASNLGWAFNNLWLSDTRVVAVTPFILNYQSEPFLGFSWQKPGENSFYSQYYTVQGLNKIEGDPLIYENISFNNHFPNKLVEDSSFLINLSISNLGQGIWQASEDYELRLISKADYFYRSASLEVIEPGVTKEIDFELHTPSQLEQTEVKLALFHSNRKIAESDSWKIKIMPLQKLEISYRLLNLFSEGEDFTVLIYDQSEHLVFEKKSLKGNKGRILVDKIRNVALNEPYRIVLLKPGYLPRQTFVSLKAKNNLARFSILLPFDKNNDGQWTMADLFFWQK